MTGNDKEGFVHGKKCVRKRSLDEKYKKQVLRLTEITLLPPLLPRRLFLPGGPGGPGGPKHTRTHNTTGDCFV